MPFFIHDPAQLSLFVTIVFSDLQSLWGKRKPATVSNVIISTLGVWKSWKNNYQKTKFKVGSLRFACVKLNQEIEDHRNLKSKITVLIESWNEVFLLAGLRILEIGDGYVYLNWTSVFLSLWKVCIWQIFLKEQIHLEGLFCGSATELDSIDWWLPTRPTSRVLSELNP